MSQWEVQPAYSQARPHDCYDIYEVGGDGLGIPGLDNLDHATARLIVDAHNRWLAAHDREVAAQALRDAAGSAIPRKALAQGTRDWLRARADQIEKGGGQVRNVTEDVTIVDMQRGMKPND